jgi:hypothetical protein
MRVIAIFGLPSSSLNEGRGPAAQSPLTGQPCTVRTATPKCPVEFPEQSG